MYLLFIDESGNPGLQTKNVSTQPCVIAGIAVPDGAWKQIDRQFRQIKTKYKIGDELKWRDFGTSTRGPLAHLDRAQKTALRTEVYSLFTARNAVRIVAVIGTPAEYAKTGWFRDSRDGFYVHALKSLSERFQYFLQDMSRETAQVHNGLLVCDARERTTDQRLVEAMHELMAGGPFISNYDNIVEGVFMADSKLSTGIQLADMIAGAIWHKEAGRSSKWYEVIEPRIRRRPNGDVTGYGIVRI